MAPPAHQAGVVIPPEIYEKYLAVLVRAGALMFRALFFGPDGTEELRDLGRALQDLVRGDGPLWLEIAAETPVVPWHLLAFPDPADPAAADPSHILGLRHRITYPPMRRTGTCSGSSTRCTATGGAWSGRPSPARRRRSPTRRS